MQLIDRVKVIVLELAEAQGLTKAQVFALYCLDKCGGLAMGRAAEALHCDASNVTGMVDRMVTQGLITREAVAHDRRTKTLQLTDKGQKVVAALKAAIPTKLHCDTLTAEECKILQTVVQKLCA